MKPVRILRRLGSALRSRRCGFQMSFAKFQLSFAIERAAKLSWKSCPGEPSFILALAPTHSEAYARSLVLPVSARYVGEKVVR